MPVALMTVIGEITLFFILGMVLRRSSRDHRYGLDHQGKVLQDLIRHGPPEGLVKAFCKLLGLMIRISSFFITPATP